MSFLDKAKEKASAIASQAKDKADDFQNKRKVDDLLDDLGRILYRQRTEGTMPDDDAAIDALVGQLKELEAQGAPIYDKAAPAEPAAPDAGAAAPPPPPPPPPPSA